MSARLKLVLIEWVDSYGCSSTWQQIEQPLPRPRVMLCQSVGWLAHDGDDCKVLIPHIARGADGELDQGCGDMTIPTSAVRSVRALSTCPS